MHVGRKGIAAEIHVIVARARRGARRIPRQGHHPDALGNVPRIDGPREADAEAVARQRFQHVGIVPKRLVVAREGIDLAVPCLVGDRREERNPCDDAVEADRRILQQHLEARVRVRPREQRVEAGEHGLERAIPDNVGRFVIGPMEWIGWGCRGLRFEFQLRALGGDLLGVERDVTIGLGRDDGLPLAREDQAQVFLHERIERLAGHAPQCEAYIAIHRIAAARDLFLVALHVGSVGAIGSATSRVCGVRNPWPEKPMPCVSSPTRLTICAARS